MLVPSEEDGGQGTLAAIRAGVTGDLAIIPEPSNARHRGGPCRRHHVPADRARPRGPRLAAARGRLGARQAVRAVAGARGGRDAPQRGRDRSADDRPRAAVPDDHRDRGGRRMGVDRPRSGQRRRALRRAARAVRGRSRGGAADVHRDRVLRGRLPARPPGHRRDHRRAVRVRAPPVGPPAARRAGGDGRGRHRPAAGAARRALRRRHADVRQRRRHPVRDLRPGRRQGGPQRRRVTCRSTRSRRARPCWPPGSCGRSAPNWPRTRPPPTGAPASA